MRQAELVILGAGPAGLHAAKAARALNKSVLLAGEEPLPPYFRPRLPEVLRTGAAADNILMQKSDWFINSGIEFMPSLRAAAVDVPSKTVRWQNGETTGYGALILACGAQPNVPQVGEGVAVHTLRTYEDAVKIRALCEKTRRALIIGAGLLGLEAAFALLQNGCTVTVADRNEYPLSHQLDREGGLFLKGLLTAHGLHLLSEPDGAALQEQAQGACVIAAAGVTPSLALAHSCGLKTGRGILVDERMRTSQDGIFACGDVAEFAGACPGLMAVAIAQGQTAGQNAAGGDAVYKPPVLSPLFKAADVSVLSLGALPTAETQVLRKKSDTAYAAAYVTGGVLTGAAFVGETGPGMKLKKHVEASTPVAGVSSFDELLAKLA